MSPQANRCLCSHLCNIEWASTALRRSGHSKTKSMGIWTRLWKKIGDWWERVCKKCGWLAQRATELSAVKVRAISSKHYTIKHKEVCSRRIILHKGDKAVLTNQPESLGLESTALRRWLQPIEAKWKGSAIFDCFLFITAFPNIQYDGL